MQTATLHVKLDPEIDSRLRQLARQRNVSKGQLVRQAVASCYQLTVEDLPRHQQQALAAYEGGFISLGKLAEKMGMGGLELRGWLAEHDIAQNTTFAPADADNA